MHFLVGTDEHGLKIQNAAKERGMDPILFCDKISKQFHVRSCILRAFMLSLTLTPPFKDLATFANIGYTRFIRTTEHEHHEAVKHVWVHIHP